MGSQLHLLAIILLTAGLCCTQLRAAPGYAEVELLVKWQDGPESHAATVGNAAVGSTVKRNFNAIGWQLVKLREGMKISEGLQAYRDLGAVLAVEPNPIISPVPAPPPPQALAWADEASAAIGKHTAPAPSANGLVPNDPRFKDQWYLRRISATNAWATATGSSNVVVAVLDRGVNYAHPDLAANMWRNPGETGLDSQGRDKATNGIDDDDNGYVDDVHGADVENGTGDPKDTGHFLPFDPPEHGTFCAGIIGAAGNNGIGISGLNWTVQIMAVRFAGGNAANTKDYVPRVYWSDNLAAWDYVVMMKRRGVNVRVTSNSYGDYFQSAAVRDAIAAAGDENILGVFSAGNQGANTDLRSRIPSGYNLPSVIAVAASTQADTLPNDPFEWSNFGRSTIHLAAPGTNFVSTWGTGYTNGFEWSGTSFAAPLVAGTAALLLSVDPNLSAEQLKAAILGSVDQPAALRGKLITSGRLNVARALEYLTNANPTAIVIRASPAGQWTATNAPLEVTFSRPMDRASVENALVINPPMSGTFHWSEDNRSFSFRPDAPLDSQASYTARILGSARDESGATLDGDYDRIREGSPADDFLWTFRFRVPNDDFLNAQSIAGDAGVIQGNNRFTTFEFLEPDHLDDPTSMSSVWYRWTPPGPGGWFTFDLTSGTAFDSLLSIYQGDQLDRLVAVAANDNYGSRSGSRVSFAAFTGTNYSVVVAGKSGDATKRDVGTDQSGNFKMVWYPTPAPGFTSTQFSPVSGLPGAKVTLTGTNFTGATSVLFNGASATFTNALTNNLDLRITALVPPDATSGPITLVTPRGNVTSTASFQVFPPPLTIRLTGANGLEITWPSASTEFVLETSETLSASSWTSVTGTFLMANGATKLTLPAPTGKRFYRLRTR